MDLDFLFISPFLDSAFTPIPTYTSLYVPFRLSPWGWVVITATPHIFPHSNPVDKDVSIWRKSPTVSLSLILSHTHPWNNYCSYGIKGSNWPVLSHMAFLKPEIVSAPLKSHGLKSAGRSVSTSMVIPTSYDFPDDYLKVRKNLWPMSSQTYEESSRSAVREILSPFFHCFLSWSPYSLQTAFMNHWLHTTLSGLCHVIGATPLTWTPSTILVYGIFILHVLYQTLLPPINLFQTSLDPV